MTTPREHWTAVEHRYGAATTASRCCALLTGAVGADQPDHPAFDVLERGGYLERVLAGPGPDYWIRVWAARGLLYVWDDHATGAVVTGLADEHWRVREMCAKVSRRRALGQAGDDLSRLVADEVPRVRLAALRALAEVGESEHAIAVREVLSDPDAEMVEHAQQTLDAMADRLDRDLSG